MVEACNDDGEWQQKGIYVYIMMLFDIAVVTF